MAEYIINKKNFKNFQKKLTKSNSTSYNEILNQLQSNYKKQ